jgi:hypothetical protein
MGRDCNIFYAPQSAGGVWSRAHTLNAQASPSNCAQAPRIAADDAGQRHIVWIAPGSDGQTDVFYAQVPEVG